MKLIHPLKEIAITNGYHSGYCLDYGTIKGYIKDTPVLSCADGTVYKTEYQKSGGYVVFILHTNGWLSYYAHLKKGSICVKKGNKVTCGQQIAVKGNTGTSSSGVHLHFGIWKNKKYIYKKTKSTMIPILDHCFMTEDSITSNTTADKYDLHRYGETKMCTVKALNVRSKPSTLGKKKSKLTLGDKVKIYEYSNSFYKIAKDSELWASSKYLK